MKTNFSPSINIIRDIDKDFNYIPTPNAHRIFKQIISDFKVGIHSFNIIGSYGTGKSAFLLAFEKTLNGDKTYFEPIDGQLNGLRNFRILNLVGKYDSILKTFADYLNVNQGVWSTDIIFDKLDAYYQEAQSKNVLLVIVIDEFGKFLEYAAVHNPEKELYFIQQLAEYAADKNIIFITTLHQSFGSYSQRLYRNQQQEWEKVKGRLKELTFNEPVEQLLFLAARQIESKNRFETNANIPELIEIVKASDAFPLQGDLSLELAKELFPLDIVSAAVLTLALQKYGQNERSLFTFLESNEYRGINDFDDRNSPFYNLSNVFDYLLHNYYSFLSTKYNPHYVQWSAIKKAIERVEGHFDKELRDALKLVKTIGLLNIFGKESARLNLDFLSAYARICLGVEDPKSVLNKLASKKIIRYVKFKNKFVLFEGTDLDIELAISEASNKIEPIGEIVSALRKYFAFPYISAKAVHYKYGTPRFFKFELSEQPIDKVPVGEVDGIINLIFSEKLSEQDIIEFSQKVEQAILFGFYRNTKSIKEILSEIEKIRYVINSIADDRVAFRELKNALSHQIEQLNAQVLNKLYSKDDDVMWFFNGAKIHIANRTEFNSWLSKICGQVYDATPVFQNELVNRHRLSSSITLARKNFFQALLNNWEIPDLGLPKDKFPAEKTIYFTLIKRTGIHQGKNGKYFLSYPQEESFRELWQKSQEFLNSAKVSRKSLSEFEEMLAAKPFKLKHGFIEFWLPLFLFIKKDDFALFGENGYIPFLTPEVIELIIKKPHKFQIKTFDVTGIKLDLFNKYRTLLQKHSENRFSNQSFIDTIRPFLTFYKELPQYTRKTKRLSKPAAALREAIENATDPEKTFFENFPRALGYANVDLREDDSLLEDFIVQLQNAIRELRGCFDSLVDRVEAHFLQELDCANLPFPEYKNEIEKRYRSLKRHLLLPHQKTFYVRLQSELEDRRAWINSLVHAVIGKTLDTLKDEEEEIVFDRLSQVLMELDNLCEISQLDFDPDKECVVKLELTSTQEGHTNYLFRIPKDKRVDVNSVEANIRSQLSKDKKINLTVLTKLLKEQFTNE
ncbi:MAG: hypothetical protein ACE5HS_03060 [bacterium]